MQDPRPDKSPRTRHGPLHRCTRRRRRWHVKRGETWKFSFIFSLLSATGQTKSQPASGPFSAWVIHALTKFQSSRSWNHVLFVWHTFTFFRGTVSLVRQLALNLTFHFVQSSTQLSKPNDKVICYSENWKKPCSKNENARKSVDQTKIKNLKPFPFHRVVAARTRMRRQHHHRRRSLRNAAALSAERFVLIF